MERPSFKTSRKYDFRISVKYHVISLAKNYEKMFGSNLFFTSSLLEVAWLNDIWRPDSFFKNAKAVTFQTMTIPNHYMWLYKDKTILYMVK